MTLKKGFEKRKEKRKKKKGENHAFQLTSRGIQKKTYPKENWKRSFL